MAQIVGPDGHGVGAQLSPRFASSSAQGLCPAQPRVCIQLCPGLVPGSVQGLCPAQPRVFVHLCPGFVPGSAQGRCPALPRAGAQLYPGFVPSSAQGQCPALGWHRGCPGRQLQVPSRPAGTTEQNPRCLPAATSAVPPMKRIQASSAASLAAAMVPLARTPQDEAL